MYEDEAAGKLFIDVNNFDIDNDTYAMTGTGTVGIEVLCPTWLRGQELKISVVSPQTKGPQAKLLAAPSEDLLRIKLSSVEYYAGIVIEAVAE